MVAAYPVGRCFTLRQILTSNTITATYQATLSSVVTLSSLFTGVVVGAPDGSNPVRLGGSNLLSFTPLGTATAGTVYVRGTGLQLAIRIFGATGRTRVVRHDSSTAADVWVDSF